MSRDNMFVDRKNLPLGWEIRSEVHWDNFTIYKSFTVLKDCVIVAKGKDALLLHANYFPFDTLEARQLIQEVLDKKFRADMLDRAAEDKLYKSKIKEEETRNSKLAKDVLFGKDEIKITSST